MPIDNYEDWQQAMLDRQIEVQRTRLREAVEERPELKSKNGVGVAHVIHGIKVAVVTIGGGTFVLYIFANLSDWFEPFLSFLGKAYETLMG